MPDLPIFASAALTVAGDAAYDAEGDAYDGTAVKVVPSAGQLAQGLRPGRQIPAQHHNWVLQQFAAVMLGLISNDALHEIDLTELIASDLVHDDDIAELQDYVANLSPRIRVYTYLTSGTFGVAGTFAPAGRVVAAIMIACGGGGGGGKGNIHDPTADRWLAGGGGGGGATVAVHILPAIDPAAVLYSVDVGAAGIGATVAGSTGGAGGDSQFRNGATILAAAPGAQGGRGAVGTHVVSTWFHYTMGGYSRDVPTMIIGPAGQGIRFSTAGGQPFNLTTIYIPMQAGQGGYGAHGSSNPASSAGSANAYGNYLGGAGGTRGADNGTARGGGGGGGGGAGPFGNGGAGASGAGDILAAGAAFFPPANSGAGGGGGGTASAAEVTPSSGADGGSGRVYIITVEESP